VISCQVVRSKPTRPVYTLHYMESVGTRWQRIRWESIHIGRPAIFFAFVYLAQSGIKPLATVQCMNCTNTASKEMHGTSQYRSDWQTLSLIRYTQTTAWITGNRLSMVGSRFSQLRVIMLGEEASWPHKLRQTGAPVDAFLPTKGCACNAMDVTILSVIFDYFILLDIIHRKQCHHMMDRHTHVPTGLSILWSTLLDFSCKWLYRNDSLWCQDKYDSLQCLKY